MIEIPHLLGAVMAILSMASLATTIIMTRGKAAADKVRELDAKLDDKASAGRVGATEERVSQMEHRLTALEGEMRHLPSRDQTHKMELALAQMSGQLQVMGERLGPIAATSERLQEFLLTEAKAKRGNA